MFELIMRIPSSVFIGKNSSIINSRLLISLKFLYFKKFLLEEKNTSKEVCQIVKQLLNEHSQSCLYRKWQGKGEMEGFIYWSSKKVRYTFYFLFLKKNVYVNMAKASFSGSEINNIALKFIHMTKKGGIRIDAWADPEFSFLSQEKKTPKQTYKLVIESENMSFNTPPIFNTGLFHS